MPGPSIAASIQRRPAAPAATYTFGQAVRATCCSAAALLDSPRAIDAQPGMLLLDRLVLLLLLPPLAGAQAQGKQNQGGGLIGEVFGAGAPGDGGRNGMDHAWDGKTDTWFDCLGPPDNFWDACYTGIKLPTPTAIGQIRFCESDTVPAPATVRSSAVRVSFTLRACRARRSARPMSRLRVCWARPSKESRLH